MWTLSKLIVITSVQQSFVVYDRYESYLSFLLSNLKAATDVSRENFPFTSLEFPANARKIKVERFQMYWTYDAIKTTTKTNIRVISWIS